MTLSIYIHLFSNRTQLSSFSFFLSFYFYFSSFLKLIQIFRLLVNLRKRTVSFSMGRTPCCDKNGLKKGPWTPEEDQKLIDYIQKNGHGNWRTLPKNAGTFITTYYYFTTYKYVLKIQSFSCTDAWNFLYLETFRAPKMWEELPFKMDELS